MRDTDWLDEQMHKAMMNTPDDLTPQEAVEYLFKQGVKFGTTLTIINDDDGSVVNLAPERLN